VKEKGGKGEESEKRERNFGGPELKRAVPRGERNHSLSHRKEGEKLKNCNGETPWRRLGLNSGEGMKNEKMQRKEAQPKILLREMEVKGAC